MKKVKVKGYSKVNLTLEVKGVEKGYHNIQSIVASISLFDAITLRLNNSGKVTLKEKGLKAGCEPSKNNAVKSAQMFLTELKKINYGAYSDIGVHIVIDKKIPVAGGLGGSSADVSGVLNGLNQAFDNLVDIEKIANHLGSDCAFMLKGGFAKMSGRGEIVEGFKTDAKIYLIIMNERKGVSAKDSYAEYDRIVDRFNLGVVDKKEFVDSPTETVRSALMGNRVNDAITNCYNGLTTASINLLPKIKENLTILKEYAPSVMCGSGSAVCCMFDDKKQRDKAYKALRKRGIKNILKAHTL